MKRYVKSSTEVNPMVKEVSDLIMLSDAIIDNFKKKNEFDPYAALDGSEDMSQILYTASVNFQATIQDAIDKYRNSTTFDVHLN